MSTDQITTIPISQAEWDVLRATSPDTLVTIHLITASQKDLKPGKKIIVRPLYKSLCGSATIRKVLCVAKYQSGIAAALVVTGFMVREDIRAYGGITEETIRGGEAKCD